MPESEYYNLQCMFVDIEKSHVDTTMKKHFCDFFFLDKYRFHMSFPQSEDKLLNFTLRKFFHFIIYVRN